MMRLLFLSIIILLCQQLPAQKIEFKVQLAGEDVELDKDYFVGRQTLALSKCKFYISMVSLEWRIPNKNYHLIDLSNKKSLSIKVPNAIKNPSFFTATIGIDSATNVAGVYGGDLDPTNGMYWTWQSGYINIKLEGTSTNCPARKNKFQFHLGGYSYPFNSSRNVTYKIKPKGDTYFVYINLDTFFKDIDLSKDYQVMSPNKKAMEYSDLFAQCFTVDE